MSADMLARQDARIHRCTCGGWVYGAQPCGTCTDQRREVAA